jgi:hypothetical protein
MSAAHVLHNNLGGVGPDEGEPILRIANVGSLQRGSEKQQFDVIFTPTDPYSAPHGYKNNGRTGDFAMLSVQEGTYTTFRASFVDSETSAPVSVPRVSMVVADLDSGSDKLECREVVRLHKNPATFDGYYTGERAQR